ncbi:MAG: hypothetical protein P8K79_10005 [Mariniblastus sp.]|nr:hypothetical protein [Mariniblastus sp.]
MNLDQKLIAEAKEQLQDDLLAFSWLVPGWFKWRGSWMQSARNHKTWRQ